MSDSLDGAWWGRGDWVSFERAVAAQPGDMTTRLVAADWLDEWAQEHRPGAASAAARAELIRGGASTWWGAGFAGCSPEARAIRVRAGLPPVPQLDAEFSLDRVCAFALDHGFVAGVSIPPWDFHPYPVQQAMARFPLSAIEAAGCTPVRVTRPAWNTLRRNGRNQVGRGSVNGIPLRRLWSGDGITTADMVPTTSVFFEWYAGGPVAGPGAGSNPWVTAAADLEVGGAAFLTGDVIDAAAVDGAALAEMGVESFLAECDRRWPDRSREERVCRGWYALGLIDGALPSPVRWATVDRYYGPAGAGAAIGDMLSVSVAGPDPRRALEYAMVAAWDVAVHWGLRVLGDPTRPATFLPPAGPLVRERAEEVSAVMALNPGWNYLSAANQKTNLWAWDTLP